MGNKMGVAKTFGRGGREQGDLIKHIHQHTDQINNWKAENAERILCRDAKSDLNSTDTNLATEVTEESHNLSLFSLNNRMQN